MYAQGQGIHPIYNINIPKGLQIDNLQAVQQKTEGAVFTVNQHDFAQIPGSPIVYWLSDAMRKTFTIMFIRNSVSGRIEARYRKTGIELNEKLHKN